MRQKANAGKFSVPQVGQKYFLPGWGVNLKNEPLQGKLGLDQLEAEFLSDIAHISLDKYITQQIYHLTNISLAKYINCQIIPLHSNFTTRKRGSHTIGYWFRGAPWAEPGAPGIFCCSSHIGRAVRFYSYIFYRYRLFFLQI